MIVLSHRFNIDLIVHDYIYRGFLNMAYSNYLQYSHQAILDELSEPIEKIRLVKTYYVIEGRNAWHSTWVQKYIHLKSFYANLKDARKFAELNRKPGSVFYINVIPGILIKTEKCNALVTQINSQSPFSKYSLERVEDDKSLTKPLEHPRLKVFLRKGVPLNIALRSFDPRGQNWLSRQSTFNNIIVEYGYEEDLSWDDFGVGDAAKFRSYSQGSYYLLGWKPSKDGVDASAIILTVDKAKKLRRVSI